MKTSLDRPLRPDELTDDAPAAFDLVSLADELLAEAAKIEAGRSAATLVSRGEVRSVLTALRAGSDLAEHKAPGTVVINCVKGRVIFSSASGEVELKTGSAIAFRPGALHSVQAQEDSAILITIAGTERPSAS